MYRMFHVYYCSLQDHKLLSDHQKRNRMIQSVVEAFLRFREVVNQIELEAYQHLHPVLLVFDKVLTIHYTNTKS